MPALATGSRMTEVLEEYARRLTIIAATSTWGLVIHIVVFNGSGSDRNDQRQKGGRVALNSATRMQVLTICRLMSKLVARMLPKSVVGFVEGEQSSKLEVEVQDEDL